MGGKGEVGEVGGKRLLVLTYVPCQTLLQQFILGTRPHKSQTHNYVSTLAENGPADADQPDQFWHL